MIKSEKEKRMEYLIYQEFNRKGFYNCHDVTSSVGAHINMLSFDGDGVWRCFNVITTASSFYNQCNNVFVGNYNYYVMTLDMLKEIEKNIMIDIGVYILGREKDSMYLARKAKYRELKEKEEVLKECMLKGLYRQYKKCVKSLYAGKEVDKL